MIHAIERYEDCMAGFICHHISRSEELKLKSNSPRGILSEMP